jgi:hypothetical protein
MTQNDKRILTAVGIIATIGITMQIINAYTLKKIKDNIVKQ